MSDAQYRLIYFNVQGRAEPIRLVLHAAGIPYKDERIAFKDWPTIKSTIPGGRMPVLFITPAGSKEAEHYEESGAIYRMLARRFDMMGSNEKEYFMIERMIGQCIDLENDFRAHHFAPENEKAETLKKYIKETAPKMLDLVYFDAQGRAEPIRLVLNAAGVSFEDKRIVFEDWPAIKSTIPSGRMPVLFITPAGSKEVQHYEESGAIVRMLARRFDLMGSNEKEYFMIERMIGECTDLDKDFYAHFLAPEDKKAEAMNKYIEETAPKMLNIITDSLKKSGGKFVAGDSVTLGDLVLLAALDHVHMADPSFLKEKFPNLLTWKEELFRQETKLAEYVKSRPESIV